MRKITWCAGPLLLASVVLLSGYEGSARPADEPGAGGGESASPVIQTAHGELTLQRLAEIQPGLGTVMIEYGMRFAMLKCAADAEDWGMAQYQLQEAIEIQEVGEATRPAHARRLSSFQRRFLAPLGETILAKDQAGFEAAYAKALDGCNACHRSTKHEYVRVQAPATSPQPYLVLAPSDPKAPE